MTRMSDRPWIKMINNARLTLWIKNSWHAGNTVELQSVWPQKCSRNVKYKATQRNTYSLHHRLLDLVGHWSWSPLGWGWGQPNTTGSGGWSYNNWNLCSCFCCLNSQVLWGTSKDASGTVVSSCGQSHRTRSHSKTKLWIANFYKLLLRIKSLRLHHTGGGGLTVLTLQNVKWVLISVFGENYDVWRKKQPLLYIYIYI